MIVLVQQIWMFSKKVFLPISIRSKITNVVDTTLKKHKYVDNMHIQNMEQMHSV